VKSTGRSETRLADQIQRNDRFKRCVFPRFSALASFEVNRGLISTLGSRCSMNSVRFYDFGNRRGISIPAAELAPGVVQVPMNGGDEIIWVEARQLRTANNLSGCGSFRRVVPGRWRRHEKRVPLGEYAWERPRLVSKKTGQHFRHPSHHHRGDGCLPKNGFRYSGPSLLRDLGWQGPTRKGPFCSRLIIRQQGSPQTSCRVWADNCSRELPTWSISFSRHPGAVAAITSW